VCDLEQTGIGAWARGWLGTLPSEGGAPSHWGWSLQPPGEGTVPTVWRGIYPTGVGDFTQIGVGSVPTDVWGLYPTRDRNCTCRGVSTVLNLGMGDCTLQDRGLGAPVGWGLRPLTLWGGASIHRGSRPGTAGGGVWTRRRGPGSIREWILDTQEGETSTHRGERA
jgi:hypothetical protein